MLTIRSEIFDVILICSFSTIDKHIKSLKESFIKEMKKRIWVNINRKIAKNKGDNNNDSKCWELVKTKTFGNKENTIYHIQIFKQKVILAKLIRFFVVKSFQYHCLMFVKETI